MSRGRRLGVVVESGSRKVFASALDWPGWSRSARDEKQAIATLLDYRSRYLPVAVAAGVGDDLPDGDAVNVRERLAGDTTTDFGAPGAIAEAERRRLSAAEADRGLRLLDACWDAFVAAVASSSRELTTGPRGGGRKLAAIDVHILEAQVAYLVKSGLRLPKEERSSAEVVRAATFEHLASRPTGAAWPERYALRRMAWHLLDHAWEIEDRQVG